MSENQIHGNNVVKCKGCGTDIFFEFGIPWYAKKVPVIVPIAATDKVFKDAPMKTSGYVSHFINCPAANKFSRDKNQPKRENEPKEQKPTGGGDGERKDAAT
jgi:hypothetical protein